MRQAIEAAPPPLVVCGHSHWQDPATTIRESHVVNVDARVLILGSMPSQMSLDSSHYYGNPQNAFWWIMGQLFDAGPELEYGKRLERLVAARVALWDVTHSCRRKGSLDSAIERDSFEANDFLAFFEQHPLVHTVFLNGKTAATLFERHVRRRWADKLPDLDTHTLPSTSPANAAMKREEKLAAWQQISWVLALD